MSLTWNSRWSGNAARRSPWKSSAARRSPWKSSAAALLLILLAAKTVLAQDLSQSPDYSDPAIASAAASALKAWSDWQRGDRSLEKDVFALPMSDARARVQKSFSASLNYLDKRKAYVESVAAYIERYRAETRKPYVSIDAVDAEELDLLGTNLGNLQARLDALRDSPAWASIRRSVQQDIGEIAGIQRARRADIPIDLPLGAPERPRPLSVIVYRDSERQIADSLEHLWTHYYQSLVNAAEQKPGGAAPLVSSITPPEAPAAAPAPAQQSGQPSGLNALAGLWRYLEGSQQFNGVEEPRQIMLELSVQKDGTLTGRYRGTLTDFTGQHNIDVSLQQVPTPKNAAPRQLTFRYAIPPAGETGQITLEGPDAGGVELTLSHSGAGMPRGREVLVRR